MRCLCASAAVVFAATLLRAPAGSATEQRDAPRTEVGNQACRPCHQAIYESYSRTAMARPSGTGGHQPGGIIPACPFRGVLECFAKGSVRFFPTSARVAAPCLVPKAEVLRRLEHARPHFSLRNRRLPLRVAHQLLRGKTIWDMSPGYAQLRRMELSHPVDATCLFCHASGRQEPMKGTINRFAGVPFLQDGVGCERCHGPGGRSRRWLPGRWSTRQS